MFSGDRAELLQRILEAKYDFEICDEPRKSEARNLFESLLDQLLEGSNVSRFELTEALKVRMAVYRSGRAAHQRRRMTT